MKITLLNKYARLPRRAYPTDAGADLYTPGNFTGVIPGNGGRLVVPLGIVLHIPEGCAGFIHPRSGLAASHGVTVLNAPGTIDHGYTGEVKIILLNTSRESYVVHPLTRIAQLVLMEVKTPVLWVVDNVAEPTQRGVGGFGSTGVTE